MANIHSPRSLAFGAALVIALVACSSSAPPIEDSSYEATDDTSSEKNPTSSGSKKSEGGGTSQDKDGTSPTGDDAGTSPSENCANEQTSAGCFQCCLAIDEQAYTAALEAADVCVCQTPGTCKKQCANTYCKGQEPDQACIQCLNGAQQCAQAASNACEKSPGCTAVVSCFQSSACDQKQ